MEPEGGQDRRGGRGQKRVFAPGPATGRLSVVAGPPSLFFRSFGMIGLRRSKEIR
jgi:hypothetical protein